MFVKRFCLLNKVFAVIGKGNEYGNSTMLLNGSTNVYTGGGGIGTQSLTKTFYKGLLYCLLYINLLPGVLLKLLTGDLEVWNEIGVPGCGRVLRNSAQWLGT